MWFAILSSKELKNKPLGIKRMNTELVLWRDKKGKVNTTEDFCPHKKARLSSGKIVNGNIQCPFHGFEFNAEGKAIHIPAIGKNGKIPEYMKVKSFKTAEKAGMIWIWAGEGKADKEPVFFDDIDDRFAYSEFRELWTVPFTRSAENQLDVMHLPFVHETTIGRGSKTLVNEPIVKWIDENKFFFYVFNEKDEGQTIKNAEELNIEDSPVYLEYIFPNTWQNHITKKTRVVAFFSPVDDKNTMIYLRFYVKLSSVKWIDKIITKLAMPMNKVILHQDKRVVETQLHDIFHDRLLKGDLPVIEFRIRLFKEPEILNLLNIHKSNKE